MAGAAYGIDFDSMDRSFPPGAGVPRLLADFAAWLEGRPWGSVGCFRLAGSFAEQAPIVDGGPLRRNFALFIGLPEGSAVGAWYPEGRELARPGIVVLGSEGQHEVLADSLEGFLAKIALRRFEDEGRWTDFAPREDAPDATGELAQWLAKRLGTADLEPLTRTLPDQLNFAEWMGRWCAGREDFWAVHPAMAELAEILAPHWPAGKKPWDATHFEVAIVGAQYQVRVLREGRAPIGEAARIEPLLRKLREDMWRGRAEMGLWLSMSFAIYGEGRFLPSFDYETRPKFGGLPADLGEARSDFARAPRPARWTPDWLRDLAPGARK